MRIAVIGAGVIGTTTAWYLSHKGHAVTVVDRAQEPADETSYANGGLLHASHAEPWNAPGVLRDLLRWIGREDSPLLLRPSRLPGMTGWGLRFLRYSQRHHFDHATRVNARLAVLSLEMMRELRRDTGIRYDDDQNGIIKIFRDQASLDKALHASRQMDAMGVRYSVLDARRTVALEPALADVEHALCGGIFYPDDESGDARLFTLRLAELCRERGVDFRMNTRVQRLVRRGGRVHGLETDVGLIQADAYVLAAGSDSTPLARPLGLKLPIYPVKGYSVTVDGKNWHGRPRIPLIDDANKVVLSMLGDRVRMAGTAEFAGFDLELNRVRAESVLNQVLKTFPSLERHVDRGDLTPWCGLRPICADGMPILGDTPVENLYLNCGAGHLGWTFACGLARLLADRISGESPPLPMEPLSLGRFR
ncbi:MAG: D-amino acid dehydrogenase [Ectothiorhodospiraceae bacterium]|nr:D-amino acid dehydrogenase [Ectothiorhodospiraceae bacterium]